MAGVAAAAASAQLEGELFTAIVEELERSGVDINRR